ncbi:hypothetical protein [Streptomyces sp. HNM0574]|uniref:hypothetical protein n=1 Tax=Streptomyces sp. HNM0574 TaxID=2714954 RepID=UPI00146D4FC8|nr:hypothetical protein [Streptomyces sp. HNM0574]NLU68217.1 hypothetical protein [Streptomyces sp. HNM0574]
MTRQPDHLADLLPQWHRLRDAEQGEPLRALLAVVAEQSDRIRTQVEQGYADWFVETADEWALPYIGDLVGHRPLPGYEGVLDRAARGGGPDASGRRLAEALSPRRDVAATVANRRRKGTLPLLEELAEGVAGWPARAVELSRHLAHHQPVRLYGAATEQADARRAARGRLADVRESGELDLAGGPFGSVARTVDVRRAGSRHRQGGHTPAGVGLYVWRLRPYSVTRAPAYCVDRARNLYTFSILGNDTPLVTRPEPEPHAAHIAALDNLPDRIGRRRLADRLADYYGPGKSFTVWRDSALEQQGQHGDTEAEPVPIGNIVVADLSDWRYRPKRGQIAVDPELGRMAFGSRSAPRHGVWVTYHYAFADELGGGEYVRAREEIPDATVYRVGPGEPFERIMDAYTRWREDRAAGRCPGEGVIELAHSGTWQEQLDFDLEAGDRLQLRSAEGTRPVVRLLDWYSNRPDALNIRAPEGGCPPGEEPRIVLDGLLVTGRGVHVSGPVGSVVVRHSTLVPGWTLEEECDPHSPQEASLVLESTTACVEIDRSILGTIEVIGDEVGTDPLPLHLRDSILDATAHHREALSAPDCRHAHAVLHAHRSTVIGEVHTHAVRIAENSIFTGRVFVARRQLGCVRFSFVPEGSRTPRRYRCVPDRERPDTRLLRPLFSSERYGTPAYGQLADGCPEAIRRGAEDGGEQGAFHDLFQPQRTDSLRARIAEYTPAGTDAGILFVT